jgi:hypothetical protein
LGNPNLLKLITNLFNLRPPPPPPPPPIANCLARGLNEFLEYKQTTILLQIFPGSKSWNPAAAPDLRQDITQTSSSTFPHTTHVISSSFFRNCTLPLLSHFLQKLQKPTYKETQWSFEQRFRSSREIKV